MLPIDLVLVRHGEGEHNVAARKAKNGDHSGFTPEFLAKHNSTYRLTEEGIRQAAAAGCWLRANGLAQFDQYWTSKHYRAIETAAHLDLPYAQWRLNHFLHERSWGDLEGRTPEERLREFSRSEDERRNNSFYWRPPNGESLDDVLMRVDRTHATLHRECPEGTTLCVCHGEIMWAQRILLERMTIQRFLELDRSDHPHDRIHNCQVLHYSRRDPRTGTIGKHLDWMRSVCPWDTGRSSNEWQAIERATYDNRGLFALLGT